MSFPTRRELVLVVGLLLTLLLLSQFHVFPSRSPPLLFEDEDESSTGLAVVEKQVTPSFPEPRLRWTDLPPETKHIAYSPGGSLVLCLSFLSFLCLSLSLQGCTAPFPSLQLALGGTSTQFS